MREEPMLGCATHQMQGVETAFERVVQQLGLSDQPLLTSAALREWAREHRNTHYVPEELLRAWKLAVNDTKPMPRNWNGSQA